MKNRTLTWDHSFSMSAKFSEELTFLTSWYAHVRVCIRGYEMLVFWKILPTYEMNDPYLNSPKNIGKINNISLRTVCSYHGVSEWIHILYLPECQGTIEWWFTLKRVRDMIRTYSQIHSIDKYSQHSSIIWPVWLNGWVLVYQISGCEFESRYYHWGV